MSTGAPSVPPWPSVRPGWPSLKMTTADAPAAFAFWALTAKSHVPRWTSAIDPAVKPAKSAASQPLLLDGSGVGGTVTSTGTTLASAVPLPEYCMTLKSSSV